eukprot:jgi/Psemu1/183272/e_gw1.30.46.1
MSRVAPIVRNTFQINGRRVAHWSRRTERTLSRQGQGQRQLSESDCFSPRRYSYRRTRAQYSCTEEFPTLSVRCWPSSRSGRRRHFSRSLLSRNNSNEPSSNATVSNSSYDSEVQSASDEQGVDGSGSRNRQRRQDNKALERFTHFALNSNMIPLGAMQDDNWLDSLDAIDTWLGIGGGYAIDSAERLLERLQNEHSASHSQKRMNVGSSYYVEQTRMLAGLQREILNSWIRAFHVSGDSSKLALYRAEKVMSRVLNEPASVNETTITSAFPIEEYISIVGGYLHLDARQKDGPTKAGNLLLTLTADDRFEGVLDISDHSIEIVRLLEHCASQLLKMDSKSLVVTELLETMTALKECGIFPEINIPEMTERTQPMLPQKPTQKVEVPKKIKEMSPFEVEVVEKRLLDALKNGTIEEKDMIRSLAQKLSTPKPRNEIIVALLEYYIRLGDSEIASHWLQELEAPFLINSFDLVESVLELWLTQNGSRVPWRADEVLKAIIRKIQQHDEKFVMSTKILKLIVDIWASSGDGSASRKIVDWYSQMTSLMVKPDGATLKMTLHALGKADVDKPLELVSMELLQQWESLNDEEKAEIADTFLKVIALKRDSADTILTFADRLVADNIIPMKVLFQSLISAIQTEHTSPSEIMSIVHSFDDAANGVDLSLYTLAIDTLFKLNEDSTPQIESVYDHVMKTTTTNLESIDPDDLSEFLYSVIAMHVNRKLYSAAEDCLKKAESILLPSTVTADCHSAIPLKCYKKIIVRNWYTAKTARKVEESFEHLLKLYRSGYSNLQPDSDLYSAYIKARVATGKEVEHNLDEMIKEYESCGKEELKPQAKAFNMILLSLSTDKSNSSNLHSKSINLLNRMADLGVQPDIKTINLVLKNTIKGKYDDAYETSTMLIDMIDRNKLNQDSHTLHLILDACGSAPSSERNNAIKKCLSTFGEIRAQNFVGPITYGILSKVIYRLASRDVRANKIGESVLSLCCKDGMLTPEVRGRLQSIMSRSAWEKQYTSSLSSGEKEPLDWSRNI